MAYTHGNTAAVDGRLLDVLTASTVTTAGNVAYTAAQFLGGLILRNTSGASRSDVTPSASALSDAMEPSMYAGPNAGQGFLLAIRNTAGAAETITLTAGSGVTLSGTMTIPQNTTRLFYVILTSGAAATVYSLGSLTT